MTTKTKIEKAIEFIAKQGSARSHDIGKAADITANQVCSTLYPYVRGGVLVSCRVEQPGKASSNEYRLATGVTAQTWRDFKVGIFSEAAVPKAPPKRITPPAPKPADRPEVSETNTGSTSAENSSLAATGRAVTVAKPHRKASQPAPGAGGHVTAKAAQNIPENIPDPEPILDFALHGDGSFVIYKFGLVVDLTAAEAQRLLSFLVRCSGALRP